MFDRRIRLFAHGAATVLICVALLGLDAACDDSLRAPAAPAAPAPIPLALQPAPAPATQPTLVTATAPATQAAPTESAFMEGLTCMSDDKRPWRYPGNIAGVAVEEKDIRPDHPRLLFTKDTLPELRRRLAPASKTLVSAKLVWWKTDMEKTWGQPYSPAKGSDRLAATALIYALGEIEGVPYAGQTKDVTHRSIEEFGRKGVEFLKASAEHWDKNSAEQGYASHALLPVCWAFDWLHPLLTAAERKEIVAHMLAAAYNQKANAQRCTFKDYSLGGHNYVVVALAVAGENLPLDHTALWNAKLRFQGNSDEFARKLLADLNQIYLNRFYAGWKFATQGGGNFQGITGHYANVSMFIDVLWPVETATGKKVLDDFEYLSSAPEWMTYPQLPGTGQHVDYGRDLTGKIKRPWKGLMLATDDENFPTSIWWPLEVAQAVARYSDSFRGPLGAWALDQYAARTWWYRFLPDMIWSNETVAAKSPEELKLPLTRYFGRLTGTLPPGTPADVRHAVGPGIVMMRSSWTDPAATLAMFKCRSWQFTHDHPDSNSFVIFKKDYLAIDSGRYQNGDWKPQEANYDYRTIAHNTLLVYDPQEKMGPDGAAANDGGQRVRDANRDWPEDYAVGGRKDVGGLVRFESVPGKYDYMLGDATRAYQSTEFAHLGNRPKLSLAQREFVYLRSPENKGDRDLFVVFDRVTSTDKTFEKRWLLHTIDLPAIDGRFTAGGLDGQGGLNAHQGTPGSISTDANLVTVAHGDGKLFCRTLLPEKHQTVLRGGPNAQGVHAEPDSYEYLDAAGKQWPLDKLYGSSTYLPECGNYRIEIIPQEARTDDVFLHVLHPAGQAEMPPADRVSSADGAVLGACVDGWCVVFARAGRIDTAAWKLPQKVQRLLVADLKPGGEYAVTVKDGAASIAPAAGGLRAGDQGTLLVETSDK